MTAAELTQGLEECRLLGDPDRPVEDLVTNDAEASPDAAFVAIRGARFDGHAFVPAALDRGARVLVVDRGYAEAEAASEDATWIVVPDTREALPTLAANFHRRPWDELTLIGVTGTNGKTSTAYSIESLLRCQGRPSARFGTVEHRIGQSILPATTTTPDALELSRYLRRAADEGIDAAVMEVSSHALCTARVKGIRFDAAVWTNLTQDHLDFHQTMDAYRDAKSILFTQIKPGGVAALNRDDPAFAHFADVVERHSDARIVSFGLGQDAEVRGSQIASTMDATEFTCHCAGSTSRVTLKLLGEYSVMNALAAIAVGIGMGMPTEALRGGVEALAAVPGRFEPVVAGQPFAVLVDYAHTPDALKRALLSARALRPSRLIVVFGCGGNRDAGKRPQMGRLGAELADVAIVTSDNPREEDPEAIIRDIRAGIPPPTEYVAITDRESAISHALGMACAGDLVLIAGKGHEDYQILGTTKIHFDDREVARKHLA